MSADRLRAMVGEATDGPWEFSDATDARGRKGEFRAPSPHNGFMLVGPWTNDADARLIVLAPDLAEWAADAADWIADYIEHAAPHEELFNGQDLRRFQRVSALLARLADLVPHPPESR